MELEKMAQHEVELVEQIAHAQYPIDMSKYVLKYRNDTINPLPSIGRHELFRVSGRGLLLGLIFQPSDEHLPSVEISVDGVMLFEDLNDTAPFIGVNAYELHEMGITSPSTFLPYCPKYDEANGKFAVVWQPSPPVRFNSNFVIGYNNTLTTGTWLVLRTWWLEEPEAGLSSQVR